MLESSRAFDDGHLLPADTSVGPQLECLWELSERIALKLQTAWLLCSKSKYLQRKRGWIESTRWFCNLDLEVTSCTPLVKVVRSPPRIKGLGSVMVNEERTKE